MKRFGTLGRVAAAAALSATLFTGIGVTAANAAEPTARSSAVPAPMTGPAMGLVNDTPYALTQDPSNTGVMRGTADGHWKWVGNPQDYWNAPPATLESATNDPSYIWATDLDTADNWDYADKAFATYSYTGPDGTEHVVQLSMDRSGAESTENFDQKGTVRNDNGTFFKLHFVADRLVITLASPASAK